MCLFFGASQRVSIRPVCLKLSGQGPFHWFSIALQVYTYLLRPLTAPGRPRDPATRQQQPQQHPRSSSTSSSSSDPHHHSNQQQLRQGSTGLSSGRQGSGGETVVGYELQLVMEYCPLVSMRLVKPCLFRCYCYAAGRFSAAMLCAGRNTSAIERCIDGSTLSTVFSYNGDALCTFHVRLQGSLRVAIDSGMLDDRLSRRPDYLNVLTLALVSRFDCDDVNTGFCIYRAF